MCSRTLINLLRGLAAIVMILSGFSAGAGRSQAFQVNHTDNPTPGLGPVLAWGGSSMPVKYQFNTTPLTGLATSDEMYAALKRSMQPWIQLATSDVTACFVGTTASQSYASGDANVCWAMNSGWDGGAGVISLTRVDFVLATGALTDADTKFNGQDATWTTAYTAERAQVGGDTLFDFQSVATHEFGHTWGLAHSLDSTGVNVGDPDYDDNGTVGVFTDDQINGPNQNTLDPVTVAGETFQRSLATDDSAGMDSSYASAGTTLSQPAVFLTEPDGIGDAPAGPSFPIKWLSQYEGASNPKVAFYYTTDITAASVNTLAGATLIASNVASPKTGALSTYTWNFTNVAAGSYYVIAVVTADGFTQKDVSAGKVTVAASTLAITAPTGPGITLNPFDSYAVTWTSGGPDLGKILIEMSDDGGITYPRLITNTALNTGTYTFTLPDPVPGFGSPGPLTQCKIRVSYVANTAIKSASANNFTLAAESNTITVVSPNGGEVLIAGSVANITFNASGTDVGNEFLILWTSDGGASYAPIVADFIAGSNPRTYAWKVPAQAGTGNAIEVMSLNNNYYFDTSDSTFTIQNSATRTFSSFPDNMVFDVIQGGSNPPAQPLYARNAGPSILVNCTVTITGDPNVTVTPNTGIAIAGAPALVTLTVGVNNVYGAVGTFTANLVFNTFALNASNEGYSVPVTVRVHAAGAVVPLGYNPGSLTFNGDPGALPPGAQTVLVVNPNANTDTVVDLDVNDLDIIVKPGHFSLAAGDATPGGADEATLTVIGDTSPLPAGSSKTSQIITTATNIGSDTIGVTFVMSGAAPSSKKKSGCAIGTEQSGAAWWLALAAVGIGMMTLRRRCHG